MLNMSKLKSYNFKDVLVYLIMKIIYFSRVPSGHHNLHLNQKQCQAQFLHSCICLHCTIDDNKITNLPFSNKIMIFPLFPFLQIRRASQKKWI